MTPEVFWASTDRATGCWLWTRSLRGKGYGYVKHLGADWSAHRLSWLLTHGEIPDGLHVLHRCDTPRCVNPDHLFLGSNRDNAVDRSVKGRTRIDRAARAAAQKAKTHCKHGHLYSGANLYLTPDGRRDCRACRARADQRRHAKGRP